MCPTHPFGFFPKPSENITPYNYRETPFNFGLRERTWVTALARPDFGEQDPNYALNYLKEHQVGTIFGLDASPELITLAKRLGMDYVDVTIPDFSAPNIELFDQIYNKIIEQAVAGKKVAIHCQGGNGRTGTVLAAMKLKELSANALFYASDNTMNNYISVTCRERDIVPCTANVRAAVLAIRRTEGNEAAVEVEIQIDSLCRYETFLRKNHLEARVEEDLTTRMS